MILFFDTETTGFPRKNVRLNHESQPHIVQIAAILCADDGREVSSMNLMINPGVVIPEITSDIHGITSEIAGKFGLNPSFAANVFMGLAHLAETFVAHNVEFDLKIIDILFDRHLNGIKPGFRRPSAKIDCTMSMATQILNIPPTEKMISCGFKKPKSPKLSEVYEYYFGVKLEGAHDALVDVKACRDVYFAMKKDTEYERK